MGTDKTFKEKAKDVGVAVRASSARYQKRDLGTRAGAGGSEVVRLGILRRFALRANAHLSHDKTVAKMGHPVYGWSLNSMGVEILRCAQNDKIWVAIERLWV